MGELRIYSFAYLTPSIGRFCSADNTSCSFFFIFQRSVYNVRKNKNIFPRACGIAVVRQY